ncbi:MAG: V4R domain-containing protein [Candidatus Jordarchaeaceae archaeon]
MRIEKTLVEFIDAHLGVLAGGTSILFICDSFTLNDAITLNLLVGINFLKQGGGGIVLGTSLPASMINDDIRIRFSPEDINFIWQAFNEGKCYYLDTTPNNVFHKGSSSLKGVFRIDNDPDRILFEVSYLREKIKNVLPDTPLMILYQNFSSSILDFGSKTVLKMFRKLTANVKRWGDIIMGLVNRDIHDALILNALIHLADFVVELRSEEGGGLKQPYIRVLKSPVLEPSSTNIHQRYAYIFYNNTFVKLPALAPAFDNFKRSISYEEGKILIYDREFLITPLSTFLFLFKELEKTLGMNEYEKFMENFGRKLGLEITNLFKSKYGLEGSDLLREALNYFLIRGWGRLIKREGSPESGEFKIYNFMTLSYYYGKSNHKVCVVVGSILAGILEGVTGKKWICNETHCIARGDEWCVFEAKIEQTP